MTIASGRPLLTGANIPSVGLGVWQVPDGPDCVQAVRWALDAGYRLIDTAQAYGNEASVGRAIRESGIPRGDIFLTTKFYPGRRDDPLGQAEGSLERLGVDYVDLYLVHWPQGGATWAWSGMEAASDAGFARAIGVSNFNTADIAELLEVATVKPAVNQIQLSPFEYRVSLVAATEAGGAVVQSYSPLGTGRHLTNPAIKRIASAFGVSAAQILIRWGIQKGFSVITKSTHRDRIEDNVRALGFELPPETMSELDDLDTTDGTAVALSRERQWWS